MPFKDKDKHREYQRKWKAQRDTEKLSLGICVSNGCKEPIESTTRYCLRHSRRRAEIRMPYQKSIFEKGLCGHCQQPLYLSDRVGFVYCINCSEKRYQNTIERRSTF